MQQTEQLCSAVRHLEEDNKELRQELRRVREELARREQHGHTLERLLEETKNTTTHNTTAAVCQHQPPQHPHNHNSTPETCQHTTPQHHHKLNSTVSELLHSRNPSVSSSPSEPQEERQQQHSDQSTDYNIIIHEHPAENRRVKTTSSSSATPTATILTPDDCFRGDP